MSSTYFVAALRCPVCGVVSPPTTATQMLSQLIDEPGTHQLRVGDPLQASRRNLAACYLTLREPASEAAVDLLELWACPAHGGLNWALVRLRDGVVAVIEPVELTKAALASAHYLSENVDEVFGAITGRSLWLDGQVRPDFAAVLGASLPD